MRTLRLSLHFRCKNRAIYIDLLASLHQAQTHDPCRLILYRITKVDKGRKHEVRAYRYIS